MGIMIRMVIIARIIRIKTYSKCWAQSSIKYAIKYTVIARTVNNP
jgi:hypothetical protein